MSTIILLFLSFAVEINVYLSKLDGRKDQFFHFWNIMLEIQLFAFAVPDGSKDKPFTL